MRGKKNTGRDGGWDDCTKWREPRSVGRSLERTGAEVAVAKVADARQDVVVLRETRIDGRGHNVRLKKAKQVNGRFTLRRGKKERGEESK